jgi:hypothetical protein
MDQLQRAAPNGAIFDIQQSDAQGSVGPVIGHGVATKVPDLLSFRLTITSGGTSSEVEEVIDYAGKAVYLRVVGAQQWSRRPAAIAHYYEMTSPQVVGTETVSGVKTYHIRGSIQSGGHAFNQDVWARTDNLYPARILTVLTNTSQTAYFLFVATAYNTGATNTIPTNITP